jgi:cellulose synthase/poly-beta-1,6-N-acetylglucosamine synthase-like glycosyltransferase
VRDAARTVANSIASIRAQTLADWELIVVDDESTDGTAEVLQGLAREEPRLRIVRQAARGIVDALNTGLAAARGEFIARLDADDVAHPERLAAQVAWLDAPENRAIGLVGCLVEYGGNRAASAGYALYVDWLNSLLTPDEIALNRFVESPFAHPSVLFRRALVARHGGYRAGDFPEDYELWLRWMDAGVGMGKVPRVLVRWNDPPARLSRIDPRYAPEAFFRLKARWIAKWLVSERVSVSPGGATTRPPGRKSPTDSARRKILVWGAGRPTRKRAAHLERHGLRIAGYIDVDLKKCTRALGGTEVPVIAPADLPPPDGVFVLGYVASRGARDLVRADLLRRGYVEGRDFLMCA